VPHDEQASGGLSDLDELTIAAPQKGTALQRLGVTAQFHLVDGHLPEARRSALAVLRGILHLAPDEFALWMGSDDDRPRRIRDGAFTDVQNATAPVVARADRLLSVALLQPDLPPRWQAEAMMLAADPRRSWLSRVVLSCPPLRALQDPDRYVRLIAGWAQDLQPQYGTAGLALVDEIGMAHQRGGAASPWLERYPGLDCAPFNVQQKPARYVTVNWLTVIGDSVVEALGGVDEVRTRLRASAEARDARGAQLLPYDGGVLIRASELPLLADPVTGGAPSAYRVVNDALRPARFEDYPEGPNIHLIDAPRATDRRRATLDWIRRFDD
jgi:hypothetical protein